MNDPAILRRLVIAGTSGDAGKTSLALGLILQLRERGWDVRAFKKGPDYIDAAWLSRASGCAARNLDSFLMGFPACRAAFLQSATASGINVIEGNRGLYDGSDAMGTHSTAELALCLEAPVILVINAQKSTRTVAAIVLGCRRLDPRVMIAGVVLNRVSGKRHDQVIRAAIERECSIPVLGSLPRFEGGDSLPSRYLGLVTPDETPRLEDLMNNIKQLALNHLDIETIVEISQRAPLLSQAGILPAVGSHVRGLSIGYLRDSSLTFYYPENLEALESAGARLVPVSPLSSGELPEDIAALYIGGGFPETHGEALSANRTFLAALRNAALSGLPIYAECGGLMLLSQAIRWRGGRFAMAGGLPFEVEVCAAPQGHGYVELEVDRVNPFYPPGTKIRGHEFHYSRIVASIPPSDTVCAVRRGTGCGGGRDGFVLNNVWASYTHVHALGTPEWAKGLLGAAVMNSKHNAR